MQLKMEQSDESCCEDATVKEQRLLAEALRAEECPDEPRRKAAGFTYTEHDHRLETAASIPRPHTRE